MLKEYNHASDEKINDFLKWLDGRVKYWSEFAYNLSSLDTSNKKLKNWYEEASDFLSSGKPGDFIYARYGYAVEELTNIELKANRSRLGSDYSIWLQASFGSTRPDIVIYKQSVSYAWIDITSEKSKGHILNKAGSGWQIMPIVCEVLYPELKLTSISPTGLGTVADRTAAARALRRCQEKENEVYNYMAKNIDRSIANIQSSKKLTEKDIVSIIEGNFKYPFRENYKYPIIYSMLILYLEKGRGIYPAFVKNTLIPLFSASCRNQSAAVDYIYRNYEDSGGQY